MFNVIFKGWKLKKVQEIKNKSIVESDAYAISMVGNNKQYASIWKAIERCVSQIPQKVSWHIQNQLDPMFHEN